MSPPDHHEDATRIGRKLCEPAVEESLYGDELGAGAQIGNYVVEHRVGGGGFATIYKARHVRLGRVAALKVLHKNLVSSPEMIRRFQQEAQAVNLIHHPSIVDIVEFGELTDGRPFFVMEWLEGQDLERHLASRGPMSQAEALALMEDLGAALSAAHAVGVVHRDLKASNVVLVPAGGWYSVKLVDFGIAKLLHRDGESASMTATGLRLGTPTNMAPEQILGLPVDARADVYALGILLFQVLTGRLPFRAESTAEVEELQLKVAPPRASEYAPVPPALDAVIDRCLMKQPMQRFAGVQEMMHALRLAATQPTAPPVTGSSTAVGVALYVEVRFATGADDLDDDAFVELEQAMAAARQALSEAQLAIAVETANTLLGLALTDLDSDVVDRRRVLETALRLRARLAARPPANARVHTALAVHAGSVILRRDNDGVRFVGGELLYTGDWAARSPTDSVTASEAALTGLASAFETVALDDNSERSCVLSMRAL